MTSSPKGRGAVKWVLVFVVTSIVAMMACGPTDTVGSGSTALVPCWDPGFGVDSCYQDEWWMEFSVNDASTTTMQVEVSGNPTRTLPLTTRFELGKGAVKFTDGTGNDPVTAGTLIRLTASNGTSTASSGWFAYLGATPTLDCSVADAGLDATADAPKDATKDAGPDSAKDATVADAATQDASVQDAASETGTTDACQPKCGGAQCGADGCGGSCGTCGSGTSCSAGACVSGCVAPWNPYWQETQYAGAWWVEYQVAGGGSLATAVTFEVVGGASYPLAYAYGKWTGGVNYVPSGTNVILHATDATGATSQTVPFQYLVEQSPATDGCASTPSTSTGCLPLARGMVTITMDDSYPSQDTMARPLLDQYGFKATVYNITRQLSLYGDLPYAQSLANDAHEVGSHTVTHPDLTTLSPQDLDDELRLSQQYLATNVGTPVDSFATPMGSYNATVLAAIKKYYTSHRTVNPGLNYVGSSVWELNTDVVYNTSTVSEVCAQMQEASKYRGWRIILFHDFTTASTSGSSLLYPIADFASILQCIQSTPALDVVTTRQGVAKIKCASN